MIREFTFKSKYNWTYNNINHSTIQLRERKREVIQNYLDKPLNIYTTQHASLLDVYEYF